MKLENLKSEFFELDGKLYRKGQKISVFGVQTVYQCVTLDQSFDVIYLPESAQVNQVFIDVTLSIKSL